MNSIIINGHQATQKEKADDGFIDGTWHVWLSNGKRITSSEEKLDQFYVGWRDLPNKR